MTFRKCTDCKSINLTIETGFDYCYVRCSNCGKETEVKKHDEIETLTEVD